MAARRSRYRARHVARGTVTRPRSARSSASSTATSQSGGVGRATTARKAPPPDRVGRSTRAQWRRHRRPRYVTRVTGIEAVRWSPAGDAVRIIDQRRLPEELVERDLRTLDEVCEAIATLAVRGAPAIGVAGAMGL